MCIKTELETLAKRLVLIKQSIRQKDMKFEDTKKDLKLQVEHWKSKFENLEKWAISEVRDLKSQIKICKNQMSRNGKDIDVLEVQRQIMEASNLFSDEDAETYENLVYYLVKEVVDAKLNEMAKKHKNCISTHNKYWELKYDKLSKEYELKNKSEKLKKENMLQKEFSERFKRLSSEKDVHWQAKLQEAENIAKHELGVYKNNLATVRKDLQLQLQKEKNTEDRHKEGISSLEKRWSNEMKIRTRGIHVKDLKLLMDSKEKETKAIQDENPQMLSEEQSKTILKHKIELSSLQQSLEKRDGEEQKGLNEMKFLKRYKRLKDSLEKHFSQLKKFQLDVSNLGIDLKDRHKILELSAVRMLLNTSMQRNEEVQGSMLVAGEEDELVKDKTDPSLEQVWKCGYSG